MLSKWVILLRQECCVAYDIYPHFSWHSRKFLVSCLLFLSRKLFGFLDPNTMCILGISIQSAQHTVSRAVKQWHILCKWRPSSVKCGKRIHTNRTSVTRLHMRIQNIRFAMVWFLDCVCILAPSSNKLGRYCVGSTPVLVSRITALTVFRLYTITRQFHTFSS